MEILGRFNIKGAVQMAVTSDNNIKLEIKNLTMKYDKINVLDNISFEVGRENFLFWVLQDVGKQLLLGYLLV